MKRPVNWCVRSMASFRAKPFPEKLDDAIANPRARSASRTAVKLSCVGWQSDRQHRIDDAVGVYD